MLKKTCFENSPPPVFSAETTGRFKHLLLPWLGVFLVKKVLLVKISPVPNFPFRFFLVRKVFLYLYQGSKQGGNGFGLNSCCFPAPWPQDRRTGQTDEPLPPQRGIAPGLSRHIAGLLPERFWKISLFPSCSLSSFKRLGVSALNQSN